MKRKLFLVFLIGLLVLGIQSDAYAKKKKMTKAEKKAAKMAKQEKKLEGILGTSLSWKPAVFSNLQKGMTCPGVKKYFPGVNCRDYLPKALAGFGKSVSEYKFYFMKGRLYAATIVFGPRLFDENRFTVALLRVAQRKWGNMPPDKLQQPKLMHYKWTNPDYDDVELKYNRTHWELKVDIASYDPGEVQAATLDEAQIRAELAKLLGPKGTYLPPLISQLSAEMSCEQVKGIFPHLDECKPGSSYNYTKATIKDHPLVAGLNLSYKNDRLNYVTLIFHYQIPRDLFKQVAFALLQEYWGKEAKVFPEKEYVSVYPKIKKSGSITLRFNGNRWELKVAI